MPCDRDKLKLICFTAFLGSVLAALATFTLTQIPSECTNDADGFDTEYCTEQTVLGYVLYILAAVCFFSNCVSAGDTNAHHRDTQTLFKPHSNSNYYTSAKGEVLPGIYNNN